MVRFEQLNVPFIDALYYYMKTEKRNHQGNLRNTDTIYTPNTHIHDSELSWLHTVI